MKKAEGCKRSSQYQEGTIGVGSTDLTQSVPSYGHREVKRTDNIDDEITSSLPSADHWNVDTSVPSDSIQYNKETLPSNDASYWNDGTGDAGHKIEETSASSDVVPSRMQQTLVKVSDDGERHNSFDSQSILSGGML